VIKWLRTQKYSGRLNSELPQMSSFSGPGCKVFNQCFTSVSRRLFRAFRAGMFFQAKVYTFFIRNCRLVTSFLFYFSRLFTVTRAARLDLPGTRFQEKFKEKCVFSVFSAVLRKRKHFSVFLKLAC